MVREVRNFQRYLRWLVATVLIAIVSTVGLVVAIDPYGLYNLVPPREGFNLVKPNLSRYQDEIKLTHAITLRPDVLILGNSRAEIGFDPEGSVLSHAGVSAYNLAIPGTGIVVSRRQVEYLDRIGINPKLLIIGLEFLDFIDDPERPTSLVVSSDQQGKHPIENRFWRFDCLYSLTSVKDALRTLIIQREKESQTITARGFNPLQQYRALVRNEGYYAIFNQKAKENAKMYLRKARGTRSNADFVHLRAVLELAARSGIEVKLVVYPYHGQVLALFESSGLWPVFDDWKLQVTREITVLRQRFPSASIKFFDFSGYSSQSCERIPTAGDRKTETRWYWEGGHFKKELGEMMMKRILSGPGNDSAELSGSRFGAELEQQNVPANRQRIVEERTRCLRAYPELFEDSANLIAASK